jgi:acyl-CoA synthetase (AMP-forming)/AMP-acid ligase II
MAYHSVISPGNVADFLLDEKDSAQPALLFPEGSYTYAEVQSWTKAFAAFLLRQNCTPGERVILAGENSLFWIAAYLGTMRAGLIVVPLPTEVQASELRHVLRATGARFAFLQHSFADRHQPEFRELTVIQDRDGEAVHHEYAGFEIPPARSNGHEIAALMFTSGSTGMPRGVMISHRNIVANTLSIIESLHLTSRDRIMAVLPFHYCFGASLLHTHLRVGGSVVVDHRFMFPEVVLRRMQEAHCTGFAGVPSHYQILLRRSALRTMSFPCLRYVQQAGGHLAPALVRELRQALPGSEVYLMYGQTEATARLSCLPPEEVDRRPNSIGRGIPGVTLRVLDEQGNCVKPGEVGEIVATGENIGRGYWGERTEDSSCFRDGALYTGDLATVDDEGFLYIVDRAKDFVKCGSIRVSCRSVEEKLLECSELVEAAVIGIPDEVLGEAVQAFVVPRRNAADGI